MMSSFTSFLSFVAQQATGAAGAAAEATDPILAVNPTPPEHSFWMPEAAAVTTQGVDWLFYAIMGLSIFCFVGITAAVILFVVKYRHRPGHKALPSPAHNDRLEITWTVIPSIIVVFIFIFGWRGYLNLQTAPRHATEIQVYASDGWSWSFTYPNGVKDNVLHVPVNKPVRLVMTAQGVLHSFYVPAFRVKQDVIPRRYTTVWFKATKPGVYRLYCTEYCGRGHSQMKTYVKVHEEGGFEQYLEKKAAEGDSMSPVAKGQKLFQERACAGCHALDGKKLVGPALNGVFGTKQKMEDGSEVTVDENYVRESILDPQAKIRAGFPPQMPSFKGQLSDDDINALVAFVKAIDKDGNVKDDGGAGAGAGNSGLKDGEKAYAMKGCAGCHSIDGSTRVGPSFKGVYGTKQKMADGTEVTIDDAYLIEAIMDPQAKIRDGFPPSMPPFKDQLSEKELNGLVEYIKSIK